ncbi:MAG: hypothetical protein AB7W47_16515 [Calditrichaceae bacterium]
MFSNKARREFLVVFCLLLLLPDWDGRSQNPQNLPVYLQDRGTGVPTSMFGTYIRGGELLIYPFFEYYYDKDAEYAPSDFGYDLDRDFRGKYTATEGLIFLGYGITDRLIIEVEAAVISATQNRAGDDNSGMPEKIEESGLGDVQTQFDYYWLKESNSRPGAFSYFEIVYPFNKDKELIGTADWEFKGGTGIIRGFGWGTISIRGALEYNKSEDKFEIGEIAVDYLKRLSNIWRVYAGIEGTQDEVELITEAQLHLSRRVFIKFNNAFGISSKATGWAPEIGVMFSFNGR